MAEFPVSEPPAAALGASGRFRRLLGSWRYAVSAADQMALSLIGFGVNLCLMRALSATDYGTVSLWMEMGLLAIGVQNALVNAPLGVHVPSATDPAVARRLESALAVVNVLVMGLTVVIVSAVAALSDSEWAAHDIATAIAIPLFVVAGLYREFYRSFAFSRGSLALLARVDGPYLAVTGLYVVATFVWPAKFSNLALAFFAMAAGCFVSRLFLRGRFAAPKAVWWRGGWIAPYREVSHDAAWALVGVVSTHLHQRGYVYVIVNLVDVAGLAAINVVGVLFRPVRVLMTSWSSVALPNLAAHLAHGRMKEFDRLVVQAMAFGAVSTAVWFSVLWGLWGVVERYFLAGRYPDAWAFMLPWGVATGIISVGHVFGTLLQAAREFRFLAYTTVIGAPITLAATAGAVLWKGYTWTMYGVGFGALITMIAHAVRLYQIRRGGPAFAARTAPAAASSAPP